MDSALGVPRKLVPSQYLDKYDKLVSIYHMNLGIHKSKSFTELHSVIKDR